jgi:hypothetical protein
VNARLEALLTLAATFVGIAFFASVPYWPKEPINNPIPSFVSAAAQNLAPQNKAPLLGPSVLAGAKPAPELNLGLPDSLASVVRRSGINGETGLIPTNASITTFRLSGTGDLVSVAMVESADPIVAPPVIPSRPGAADPLFVRGQYAVASVDRGITHIRWTENGITFDIASRTLATAKLAEVANKLR